MTDLYEEYKIIIANDPSKEGNVGTIEAAAVSLRKARNSLLQDCDWVMLSDVPEETKSVWAVYRQALRDITEQEGWPLNAQWPEKPQ